MTELAPLSLDDLTFEDLRQLAMRRIPAASGGRWTHHEPVDSGVTLLELFALLLDQQLFVLDQVPDSLTDAQAKNYSLPFDKKQRSCPSTRP